MFDTYMDAHALDPNMRRRMSLALGTAVIASAVALVGYASAERLTIVRVGAPTVELDFLLATSVVTPMSAVPPPAPKQQEPAAVAATDHEPPTRPIDDRSDILDPEPRTSTTSSVPSNAKPGVPGAPTGVPGPPIGMPCIGTCTIGTAKPVPPTLPPPTESPRVPLDVAQGRVIFSPDPPRDQLLATRAGTIHRGGTSVVEFCVGTNGRVDKATTKRSAGDGDVDRICRDTIKRWRFRALEVQNRPTRMCSEMTFVISFE